MEDARQKFTGADKELMDAILEQCRNGTGDAETTDHLRRALRNGADPNCKKIIPLTSKPYDLSPIVLAVVSRAPASTVRFLLEAGAETGGTILHLAASVHAAEIVEVLLAAGCDVDALAALDQDFHAQSALTFAILKLTASNGPSDIYCGSAPQPLATVQALVRAGADVTRRVSGLPSRDTFLHIVCSKPVVQNESLACDLAQILLDAGADVSGVSTVRNEQPLKFALLWGAPRLAQILISAGADYLTESLMGNIQQPPLITMVSLGKLEMVKVLCAVGAADINKRVDGTRTMTQAVIRGDVPILRELLRAGSWFDDVDRVVRWLGWAAEMHTTGRILEALIDVGADVDQSSSHGLTPLSISSYSLDLRGVRRLLRAGASLDMSPTAPSLARAKMETATGGLRADGERLITMIDAIQLRGWRRWLAEPRWVLAGLRCLCETGRAAPRNLVRDAELSTCLAFVFPSTFRGGKTRRTKRCVVAQRLPDPAFVLVLQYWWGG